MKNMLAVVGSFVAVAASAETVGFWTFEGAPGSSIAVDTAFANKIGDGQLALRAGDRYGNAEAAGTLSTFVEPCGTSSRMYLKPARFGTETPLVSAYHIVSPSSSNSGCPLYLDDPNGTLKLQTFTLEMLVRFPERPKGWAMIASRNYHYFGAGQGTYYNGLYLQGDTGSWVFHYCCHTDENGVVGYGDIELGRRDLFDGKWHHISLCVNESDHKVSCSMDSVQLQVVGTLPGPLAYDYAGGGAVERNPWVFGNHQVYGNYSWAGDFAAIRFSDQCVGGKDAMRMGTTRADGRTLLWLPLDADFGALANVDEQPTNGTFASGVAAKLAAGTVFFTNCVKNVRPEDGAGARQRANNTGSLALKGDYVDLAIKPYLLDIPNAITVEFFLNARLDDIQRGGWIAFLSCRHDTKDQAGNFFDNRLPFSFQEDGSGGMYYRADTPGESSRNRMSQSGCFDGDWHHVALTLESGGSGKDLTLTAYLDYKPVGTITKAGTFTIEDYHFLRIGQKDKPNSTFLIDEIRISKSALGVDDFLRLKGPRGLLLQVR